MVTCGVRRLKHSTADQIFGYYLPGENITLSFLSRPGWPAPGSGGWLCPGGQLLAWVTGSWHACLGLSRWPAPGPGDWHCSGGQLLAWVTGSWHACLGLSRWLAPGPGDWLCPGGQLLADLELSLMHTP